MSVERDQAERIAALARLRFEDDELQRVTEELNHILDQVVVLKKLERSSTDASQGEWEGESTRRAGAEVPDKLDAALESLAPDWRDGFFIVPPPPGVHEGDE